MANRELTLELINKGLPVKGLDVAKLQLSLKLFEERGWVYDKVADVLNPPIKPT